MWQYLTGLTNYQLNIQGILNESQKDHIDDIVPDADCIND